jgi:hypothetical protein
MQISYANTDIHTHTHTIYNMFPIVRWLEETGEDEKKKRMIEIK